MYDVSETWTTLVSREDHYYEVKVEIGGTEYYGDQIMGLKTSSRLFREEEPGVGACLSGELDITIVDPEANIPRMAEVNPYVRVTDGSQYAEWIPQGKFFIDTREVTNNDDGMPMLTIHAYDSMMKTEADYPSTSHNWPMTDIEVVQEIADEIGVGVNDRTVEALTQEYEVGLPAGYTMREVLSSIAGFYGGNFVMDYDGNLLFVGLGAIPKETRYLIDRLGNAITFGGVRILV